MKYTTEQQYYDLLESLPSGIGLTLKEEDFLNDSPALKLYMSCSFYYEQMILERVIVSVEDPMMPIRVSVEDMLVKMAEAMEEKAKAIRTHLSEANLAVPSRQESPDESQ